MARWSTMLNTVEAKGWHLYRALPTSDLADLVAQGKVGSIERRVPYVLLPAASRHNDVQEIAVHVDNARKTSQMPTYRRDKHPGSMVESLMLDEDGLYVRTRDSGSVLFISATEMEDAVKSNLSTYNVHFFSGISELREFFVRQGLQEQTPTALPRQLRWVYVDSNPPSKEVKLMPSNPSPILFRGQTMRYKPCYPACARKVTVATNALTELPDAQRASVILNLVKTEWFNENLRRTGAMQWMFENQISFDETAVAQHYGLPTGYIDVSQSFDVASFFACCKYDPVALEWQPVAEGMGVVYVVDARHPACMKNVRPICLQAFPRPSEQWAWVCEMSLGQDFEMFPYVRKFLFRHDGAASQRVLDRFDQGAGLFPPDPLSEVATEIAGSDCLPKSVAERVVEDLVKDGFGLPGADIGQVLARIEEAVGIEFSASKVVSIIDDKLRDIDNVWKDRFPRHEIGIRLVRTPRNESP